MASAATEAAAAASVDERERERCGSMAVGDKKVIAWFFYLYPFFVVVVLLLRCVTLRSVGG